MPEKKTTTKKKVVAEKKVVETKKSTAPLRQTATLRYLRIAPRKARLVASLLKGMTVNEAEAQLLLQRKRPAKPILKLLRSAVSNAKNSKKLDSANLFIEKFTVDGGPMLKRYLPRARGSASPIEKKMSHLTITLCELSAPKENRFVIPEVKKKSKLSQASKEAKRPKKEEGGEDAKTSDKPGFFRRQFNRKAI